MRLSLAAVRAASLIAGGLACAYVHVLRCSRHELLARVLLDCGEFGRLEQQLLYRAIADHVAIAQLL
ncbi:MAG: hypothetical protein ACK4ZJ_17290, partial [Allorhizobium sp.]